MSPLLQFLLALVLVAAKGSGYLRRPQDVYVSQTYLCCIGQHVTDCCVLAHLKVADKESDNLTIPHRKEIQQWQH